MRMKVFILILVSIIFKADADSQSCSRNLTMEILCPSAKCDSKSNSTSVYLVHISAEGVHDTVHYLYSTSGVPSVLIARTSVHATPNVNYTEFLNRSTHDTGPIVNFTETPSSLVIVLFRQLIEYDDKQDTTDMGQADKSFIHDLSQAMWNMTTISNAANETVVFSASSVHNEPHLSDNGSFSLKFNVLCNESYSTEPPHLQYTSNITLVDMVLDNLNTEFNSSRFALSLVVVTNGSSTKSGGMNIEQVLSLDDEHSPGSFRTINWLTSTDDTDSFLQWKPACFVKEVRNSDSMSHSHYYDLTTYNFTASVDSGLARDYFGDVLFHEGAVKAAKNDISFGLKGDKFYTKTNYTVWSFSIGLGKPPTDQISPAIIIIIAIGLGIPIIIILAGVVYTCVKKHRHREGYMEISSSYSEIN